VRIRKLLIALVGAPAALFLVSCASTPASEFYVLTPMPRSAIEGNAPRAGDLSIGVGPARLSEYLDRPNIVTRSSPNRLQIDEFHRWGGSLQNDLLTVLAQNLSLLLGTDDVLIYPWDDPVSPDYRVQLSIRRFDGGLDGSIELDARWIIIPASAGVDPIARRTLISQPVAAGDHEALVVASSQALQTMSREIAEQINTLIGAGR
jgi:uncharacterized lipoprotein YmbA